MNGSSVQRHSRGQKREEYRRVFADDYNVARRARERLEADGAQADPVWREAFADLLEAYEQLLGNTVRLTRLADNTANELFSAQKELRRSLGEIEELNDELVAMNREKTEILAMASHDLKNPLSGIQGLASLLREDETSGMSEAAREMVEMIEATANHMFGLVNNLLDLNRIEEGAIDIVPATLRLDTQVLYTVERFQRAARAKKQTLAGDGYPEAWVHADEDRLQQVLDNLVSNAIKYTPAGKAIDVHLVPVRDGWQVCIRDEGPGLSEADQQKLFRKFARLTPRPTAGENSTGLGLAIVKRLVELQGGTVACQSAPGEGSTFSFTLPSAPPATD